MVPDFDADVRRVLAEFDARIAAEKERAAGAANVDDFLLEVGIETGALLNLLIKGAKARSVLEIGTSYGYSTLFLAEAARAVGGTVTTIEISEAKSLSARASIARAGLGASVDFQVGDAVEVLARLDGPFDFVLMDLWKDLYVPCLNLVRPKLSAGAVIVADNIVFPPSAREHADAYRGRVRELGLDSVLLEVGNGLEVSRNPGRRA